MRPYLAGAAAAGAVPMLSGRHRLKDGPRWLSVNYSPSVLASPRFTRLFGLMMLVVGVVFVAAAVAEL